MLLHLAPLQQLLGRHVPAREEVRRMVRQVLLGGAAGSDLIGRERRVRRRGQVLHVVRRGFPVSTAGQPAAQRDRTRELAAEADALVGRDLERARDLIEHGQVGALVKLRARRRRGRVLLVVLRIALLGRGRGHEHDVPIQLSHRLLPSCPGRLQREWSSQLRWWDRDPSPSRLFHTCPGRVQSGWSSQL
ncbi:hypothetical protein T492DRAFT_334964 [Pavlovales sp. CCMP2436]|nr:hypothetical protein T492DRAFT_334964 [Pavlovales sp. CCMP2436]